MGQYTLPFNPPACFRKENFFVSTCNKNAFTQINRWPHWKIMLLTGPSESGKTHLGHIWAEHAGAMIVCASDTTLEPEQIQTHCLIDDIEHRDETSLFHAINLCKEQETSLLLTAGKPVKQLDFTLPDLTSRLLALPTTTINNPDDEALAGVIRKQFADRQIGASEEVVHYLLTHSERSFLAVSAMVTALDNAMWKQKKNLTIPFVRGVIKESSFPSDAQA